MRWNIMRAISDSNYLDMQLVARWITILITLILLAIGACVVKWIGGQTIRTNWDLCMQSMPPPWMKINFCAKDLHIGKTGMWVVSNSGLQIQLRENWGLDCRTLVGCA